VAAQGCEEYLALRPGVYLAAGKGDLRLYGPSFRPQGASFGAPDATKRALLERLAGGRVPRGGPADRGTAGGGCGDDVSHFLDALESDGWLTRTVCRNGRDLYTVRPLGARSGTVGAPSGDLVLSRFTVLRREGDQILVESPLARAQVLVHHEGITSLIARLARPATGDPGAAAAAGELPPDVGSHLLEDLSAAGLVVPAAAEEGPDTVLWSAHDLWFHARSRTGNGGYAGTGFGRTGWGKKWCEPLPARREAFPGPPVELHRPDLEALRRSDVPLTAAVEDRRSVRSHDDGSPVTVEQLGEFLHRCARARHPHAKQQADRPYPAGGGAYELELYLVVRKAAGLDQGMYHYDAHEHRLRAVCGPGPRTTRLLRAAAASAAVPAPPQVLIVVAARFGRLMWTYEGLPYSLVLKHVGALYQTMYLVATSMGLAACALGAGDPAAFAEATGLARTVEGSVGEFMIGSRPTG